MRSSSGEAAATAFVPENLSHHVPSSLRQLSGPVEGYGAVGEPDFGALGRRVILRHVVPVPPQATVCGSGEFPCPVKITKNRGDDCAGHTQSIIDISYAGSRSAPDELQD